MICWFDYILIKSWYWSFLCNRSKKHFYQFIFDLYLNRSPLLTFILVRSLITLPTINNSMKSAVVADRDFIYLLNWNPLWSRAPPILLCERWQQQKQPLFGITPTVKFHTLIWIMVIVVFSPGGPGCSADHHGSQHWNICHQHHCGHDAGRRS